MPFSDKEFAERFVKAMGEIDDMPEVRYDVVIKFQDEGKPRASGIGTCARQQLLKLNHEEETDPGDAQYGWPAWMGYAGEEISARILTQMGYVLARPDLGPSDIMSGHIDRTITGLDFEDEVVLWDSKLRNVFGMKMLVQNSNLRKTDPQMYLQMQHYMERLGLKRTMLTIMPHDYSTFKSECRRYKVDIVEPLVHRIFVAADKKAQQLATDRAATLIAAQNMDMMVRREFNPGKMVFPCTFCPYHQRCIMVDLEFSVDDSGLIEVPVIPEEWSG